MTLTEITEAVNDLSYRDNFPVIIDNYKINIQLDEFTESPREWGSPFTMVCSHDRYTLGDEQWKPNYSGEYAMYEYFHGMSELFPDKPYYDDFTDEDLRRLSEWADENVLWLPLYLYDHSGITMKTSPFSSSWDSGMVGFIYITRKDVRKHWDWQRISKKREGQLYDRMRAEVNTYDMYLREQVYCFYIEYKEEHLDSCGGIYDDSPDYDYIKDEYIIPAIKHHHENN